MIIALVVLLVVGISVIVIANRLIGYKNQVKNIFGSMDAIYKKRYDLLPNLVAVVKQYMQYESDLLEKIAKLRESASASTNETERHALQNELSAQLKALNIRAEAYPDLKANNSFIHLQKNISIIEEELSAARRAYNQSVTDYNNAVEMFPSSIIANMMSYKTKELFSVDESVRQNVDMNTEFKK